jgi:hypothetical protein
MTLYSARFSGTIHYPADSIQAAREVADLISIAIGSLPDGSTPAGFDPDRMHTTLDQISVSEVPAEDPEPI